MERNKTIILVVLLFVGSLLFGYFVSKNGLNFSMKNPTNFEECVAAGNPIMESYPAQCIANGETFLEEINGGYTKKDIVIETPSEKENVKSPLVIKGKAKGYWFFEGSFPITLYGSNDTVLAETFATTKGDWMTEDFVDFEATVKFVPPGHIDVGILVFTKSNPSDKEELDDQLELVVGFR